MNWINKKVFLVLSIFVFLQVLVKAQINTSSFFPNALSAVVGTEFSYQTQFDIMKHDTITSYKLLKAPSGMTIDSTKGLIKWMPSKKGLFAVETAAYSKHGRVGTQFLSINVVSFLGTIAGTVKNSSNVPLSNIQILILNIKPSIGATVFDKEITLYTDSLGAFTIKVDSGSYYIQARPYCNPLSMRAMPCANSQYLPQWYINS